MPVSVATSEKLDWAYLIWQRSVDDYLVTVLDGLSAGWRIKYSYAGHRMTGFEVLARADDVICPAERFPAGRLPAVTELKLRLAFAHSRDDALLTAVQLLNLGAVIPGSTGGVIGSAVSLETIGDVFSLEVVNPDGSIKQIDVSSRSLALEAAGDYVLNAKASNGKVHPTRIHVFEGWKQMAERALNFHRQHYQLECGAFARSLRSLSLLPDGRQASGYHYGNPDEGGSCKTGEFGGFGAWALIVHQSIFGCSEQMSASVDRYFGWMLNRGREGNPRPGTVSFSPHRSQGLDYSPYHLFEMICYVQYETWFVRQLADAISLGDKSLLPHLQEMCRHVLNDHCDDEGVIWNQNFKDETPVDYSTVDCPLVHLLVAARVLEPFDPTLSCELLGFCRKQAEHLYKRGFDFPTEGEPCTEDGSIACQAWGLAFAFNNLENPDPRWVTLAAELMDFHSKLEMFGTDARSDGSSLRFWESMYESDNYGPSINAGHGWTLWSAYARWELYLATGDSRHLFQSWRHTIPVANKFDDRGASFPCYTPDLIPAAPHDDQWGDAERRYEGRITSIPVAWGYQDTISMSGMFLFLFAPESWYRSCGFDPSSGLCANAKYVDGKLTPATPLPCERIALTCCPSKPLELLNLSRETEVTISIDSKPADPQFPGAENVYQLTENSWRFSAPEGRVTIISPSSSLLTDH